VSTFEVKWAWGLSGLSLWVEHNMKGWWSLYMFAFGLSICFSFQWNIITGLVPRAIWAFKTSCHGHLKVCAGTFTEWMGVIWHKIHKFGLTVAYSEKARELISKSNENDNFVLWRWRWEFFCFCHLFWVPKRPKKCFRGCSVAPCLTGPKDFDIF